MKATLNLFDSLLGLARQYREQGRLRDAFNVLDSLTSFPELPAATAEEAQAMLAEIHLKRRRFPQARRHLTAALEFNPHNAHYHFLLGVACRADNRGDLDRAGKHYRRSLDLDPKNVNCMSEYGLLLVRQGCVEQGLAFLREAVARLIKGMRRAGLPEEARAAAKAALFRNPRSPRFLQLWQDYQYRQILREQVTGRRGDTRPERDAGPRVLPFLRLASPASESATGDVRQDAAESLAPPHFPKSVHRRVQ